MSELRAASESSDDEVVSPETGAFEGEFSVRGALTGATTGEVVPKKHHAMRPTAMITTIHNIIFELFDICLKF